MCLGWVPGQSPCSPCQRDVSFLSGQASTQKARNSSGQSSNSPETLVSAKRFPPSPLALLAWKSSHRERCWTSRRVVLSPRSTHFWLLKLQTQVPCKIVTPWKAYLSEAVTRPSFQLGLLCLPLRTRPKISLDCVPPFSFIPSTKNRFFKINILFCFDLCPLCCQL